MNRKFTGLGVERKRLALLGILLLALVHFLWSNVFSNERGDAPRQPIRGFHRVVHDGGPADAREIRHLPGARGVNSRPRRDALEEFRPSLRRIALETIDRSSIDPTLRIDLLAKLQNLKVEHGARSLFEFSESAEIREPEAVHPTAPVQPMPEVAPPPPPPPPPPAIALKFFGFVHPQDVADRRAFFLDGEDIFVGSEGDMLEKRYKIVHINQGSALVEDMQFSNRQTLPLLGWTESAG